MSGVVWVFGEPASFKTFTVMDMVQAISARPDWMGHPTYKSPVIYLAGEGGPDVDYSRAAADWNAECTGALRVVHLRPMMDDPTGLATLKGLFTNLWHRDAPKIDYERYLDADERQSCAYEANNNKRKQAELSAKSVIAAKQAGYEDPEDYEEYEDPDCYTTYDRLVRNMALEKGLNATDAAQHEASKRVGELPVEFAMKVPRAVVVVLDTYSKTSRDDSKMTVAAYMRTLYDFIALARSLGILVSFIVVDHATKDGTSYMGSLDKLGSTDVMIEATRNGDSVTLTNIKMRGAPKFAPIHLDMVPFVLEGYQDSAGRTLSTLVVRDGTKAHKLRQAVGADGDTATAILLGLFQKSGQCSVADLRTAFRSHSTNLEKNADSVNRAFRRALSTLVDQGHVVEDGDHLTLPPGSTDTEAGNLC